MATEETIWLLCNAESGSNSDAALQTLETYCCDHGFNISRRICFPDEALPTASELEEAGINRLAIFTGDGTLNAAITNLYGWSGSILVLPGGTMNLLSKRLHGDDADLETIVSRIATGAFRTVRPNVARCEAGDALAGLLVGPATAWGDVREAMRDVDVAAVSEEANDAVAQTAGGDKIHCLRPELGRKEGYPLVEITPSHRGMQLDGYYADTTTDYLRHGFSLLRRRFREGPHERLGLVDEMVFESEQKRDIPVLVDGEKGEVSAGSAFTVAECAVDLLATHHGY
ncbi:acylglycerol kinase family protein [Qipengyuania sp. GH38]|uniref:acylglycerol kinase family protein n=1 Tax=Qipengyuania intermedia TaxID=2867244 RepID=UPI001C88AD51|nr:acylglycerol kinase family protein [Qipengyuania intermedia]MBX7513971.1 acylglycerol kinase family protein [Qipengyuania intermedia]